VGCNHFEQKDGAGKIIAQGFICTSGKTKRCKWCDKARTKLCDFPKGKKTCDAPMCDFHSKKVGINIDYCPDHAQALDNQKEPLT